LWQIYQNTDYLDRKKCLHNVIKEIYCRTPRGPKKAWPVTIAVFATIVNPDLNGNDLGFVKVNPII